MNCGYCKDCKHWDTSEEGGNYRYVKRQHFGNCLLATESAFSTKAVACGYEDPILATAAEFGCVQFEQK